MARELQQINKQLKEQNANKDIRNSRQRVANKKLLEENKELKEEIEELNLIVGIRQKRNLISKFDKEYDEEDKKKNPNRDYVRKSPDAEEVYKRYYELKEQLEYLRSGEYYNQLRFERDMLQDVVDNGEVSKEDKEFIDMTHRNTELLEQLQQRDEIIKEAINYINKKAIRTEIQETKNIVNILYSLRLSNHEFIELEDILTKYKGDNNE